MVSVTTRIREMEHEKRIRGFSNKRTILNNKQKRKNMAL